MVPFVARVAIPWVAQPMPWLDELGVVAFVLKRFDFSGNLREVIERLRLYNLEGPQENLSVLVKRLFGMVGHGHAL